MIEVRCWSERQFVCDPGSTALVVIDMQRDFVDPAGACAAVGADVRPLLAIVPRVQSVLAEARRLRMPVVHTRYGFRPDLSDLPEAVRRQSRDAGGEYGTPGPLGRILTQGEAGHAILEELAPAPGELVIDKATFGAFTRTLLEAELAARRVTHLVICGVTTQCCVEGTIREAVDRGYYVLTLEDCCAAFEPDLHAGTLRALQSEGHLYGWIASGAAFQQALQRLPS